MVDLLRNTFLCYERVSKVSSESTGRKQNDNSPTDSVHLLHSESEDMARLCVPSEAFTDIMACAGHAPNPRWVRRDRNSLS